MSTESSKQLIIKATEALKLRKNSDALKLLDQAVELTPDLAEIYSLRGIAFAQTGRAEAATESFRKATMLEPSASSFYNLAAHQFNIGDKAESLETVEESLKLDPNYPDAKTLMAIIAGVAAEPEFSANGLRLEPTALARKRRYGFGRKHLFAVLAENQEPWVYLGWLVVALSIVSIIVFKFNFPFAAPKTPDPKSELMGFKPKDSFGAFATIGFFVTMILASMIWTSLDLIDRRGRALWMIPMMICCFLFLPFIPQSLYMAIGRREGS